MRSNDNCQEGDKVLTWTRKYLLVIVAANVAAVMVGVATAATLKSGAPAASASGNCTHYTIPYFTGDPSTQPQLCYQYASNPVAIFSTTSTAVRTSNAISWRDGPEPWQLWYEYGDGTYYCCYADGTSSYHAIGGSNGSGKAAGCKSLASGARYMYCTTLW
jgi:hypothetical protein